VTRTVCHCYHFATNSPYKSGTLLSIRSSTVRHPRRLHHAIAISEIGWSSQTVEVHHPPSL
jgi:hypothetical protein